MKNFWRLFYIVCASSTLVLIFLVVSLFEGDQITYTDLAEATTEAVPTIQSYSPITGNIKDPTVIIYSYNNFACAACKNVETAIKELVAKTPEVAVVWKDLPNSSLYPSSVEAAVAGRCALQQDAFWDFHDRLFANQGALGRETYLEIAQDLELNEKKFAKCFDGQKTLPYVNADAAEAAKLSLIAAPTIIVNNQTHTGPLRPQELELMVARALDELATQ
jgi:protein-disulfide isomerase